MGTHCPGILLATLDDHVARDAHGDADPREGVPAEALEGKQAIEAAAGEAERRIDPEHFGISLAYAHDALPQSQITRIARRRPGIDPTTLIPVGFAALRETLERYIEVGFSKFVIRPSESQRSPEDELCALAEHVLDLQT